MPDEMGDNNLSFKLVRKQFFCANCGVFVSKDDEHCPHCGRLFLEVV